MSSDLRLFVILILNQLLLLYFLVSNGEAEENIQKKRQPVQAASYEQYILVC
jgi:hypothetical protein